MHPPDLWPNRPRASRILNQHRCYRSAWILSLRGPLSSRRWPRSFLCVVFCGARSLHRPTFHQNGLSGLYNAAYPPLIIISYLSTRFICLISFNSSSHHKQITVLPPSNMTSIDQQEHSDGASAKCPSSRSSEGHRAQLPPSDRDENSNPASSPFLDSHGSREDPETLSEENE